MHEQTIQQQVYGFLTRQFIATSGAYIAILQHENTRRYPVQEPWSSSVPRGCAQVPGPAQQSTGTFIQYTGGGDCSISGTAWKWSADSAGTQPWSHDHCFSNNYDQTEKNFDNWWFFVIRLLTYDSNDYFWFLLQKKKSVCFEGARKERGYLLAGASNFNFPGETTSGFIEVKNWLVVLMEVADDRKLKHLRTSRPCNHSKLWARCSV